LNHQVAVDYVDRDIACQQGSAFQSFRREPSLSQGRQHRKLLTSCDSVAPMLGDAKNIPAKWIEPDKPETESNTTLTRASAGLAASSMVRVRIA
jgi:hypothetical protein